MYDKLPIGAFVSEPKTPDPDMNLPNLQFWNCMDYGVVTIDKKNSLVQWIMSVIPVILAFKRALMCVLLTTIIKILMELTGQQVLTEHAESHNLIETDNGQCFLCP